MKDKLKDKLIKSIIPMILGIILISIFFIIGGFHLMYIIAFIFGYAIGEIMTYSFKKKRIKYKNGCLQKWKEFDKK